jgi:hypothetical protein
VSRQILAPAIARANEARAAVGLPAIGHVTNHSLRKMARQRDTGARMGALVRGADWAQTGTNADEAVLAADVSSNTTTEEVPA